MKIFGHEVTADGATLRDQRKGIIDIRSAFGSFLAGQTPVFGIDGSQYVLDMENHMTKVILR